MGQKLNNRIEIWKKLLLDFGKRNRLINFIEGKRNNVRITLPSFDTLWDKVVVNERELIFPYAQKMEIDEDGEEIYEVVIKGDIETSKPLGDLQKTLKSLRQKANTSIEEQGINTLYLTFGMLKWKENDDSDQIYSSPIILVPIKLLIESITSPYRLALHDDEIVINPTLSHKLDNDFGIILPTFDSTNDSPGDYLDNLSKKVNNKNWRVERSTHLTNLSFLKINMYKDLERNEDKLNANPIISALAGEYDPVSVPEDLHNFDHDKQIRPIDTFQVVDADSSQQDAVLLSKRGASFVLQGPPGTGKSQTITNIIAEAIADGKKVLFVSEKMAALQVVYNRLSSVGLADFCFTLHSHKAKKKEILRDLANSINIDHTRVRDAALAQLDILERKRSSLNEYQEQLHTQTSGLNISIFTVNGRLAKLSKAPDVIFSIESPHEITNTDLNERIYLLQEFAKTVDKRSEDYSSNVWRNSSIRILTNELRHNIDSNINELIPLLTEQENLFSSICSESGIKLPPSLDGCDKLAHILDCATKAPIIPIEWVINHNVDSLIDNAYGHRTLIEDIVNTTKELKDKYNEEAPLIDAAERKDKICKLMHCLQERYSCDDADWVVSNISNINQDLKACFSKIDSLFEIAKDFPSNIGIRIPNTVNQLIYFANNLSSLEKLQDIHPTKKWFDSDFLNRINCEFEHHKSLHNKLLESRNSIISRFDKEILEWDFYPVLQRFRREYKSIFRIFKSDYRKDIKLINSFLSNGDSLSYSEALNTLNMLKCISDNKVDIDENIQLYKDYYGKYYNGINTQWDVIYDKIKVFHQEIKNIHTVPIQLKELIVCGKLPISDIKKINTYYKSFDIKSLHDNLASIIRCNSFDINTQWNLIKAYVQKSVAVATEFISEYQDIINLRKNDSESYDSIISDLDLMISLNSLNKELEEQKDIICNLYKDYYNGVETNWERLLNALKYAAELKNIFLKYNLPIPFIKDICENSEVISYYKDKYQYMSNIKGSLQKYIKWFISLFEDKEDFYQYNILDLIRRITLCKDKKYLLEEWVDYCSNREKCKNAGLEGFINKIEELGIDSNYIINSYLKRFYHLWLDAVLPNFPAVQNFRGRIQTQTINEFSELDKGQFKIAQARVRERALSRMPDFNYINGARDEIGILKRELSKQRKLMPLRKLFMAIPNLITSLRPCFMMSPLSVSVFLEAQSYKFDLVIFDEASQVHTEDAIGAIMRGKQVIIVGDNKQLPPTSFFSTSINEEDYDVDSDEAIEDCDAGAYESILDEAMAILPERSLRWHYRSRHEDLITFSNVKIYNNHLITFPSSTESAPDCGVEYVYVKDGIYDRGGKKNNVIEAKKVAELVFDHFNRHPNRSLGVVTFSEAQQSAVDAAIRQIRLQKPQFDKFFNEDKEEPFFIKNLENVQGDERDTIIFSIGYAKDNKGLMYMNFGPLSREGGYRRLNVAITRAKHNIKLVGSIVPNDIDIERVSSEGVKMLRSYIEFAQQGVVALEREISINYDLAFDSPFEEAVYDFLQSRGYNVVTQVGCSGFRIDMAIKHPTQNGKFAIGIECDGATYHSSRTARERDRLRQEVLENMGWTIYRIWSTDWIKDQKTEEEKLINAVEKVLGRTVEELENDEILKNNNINIDTEIPYIEIEEKIDFSEDSDNGYGFDLYKRAHPLNIINENGDVKKGYDIVREIISIEQPIHFDELCRRIAPAYGRRKATSIVRDEVEAIINYHLRGLITIDKNEFVRTKFFTDIKVRVPNPDDDYLRPITYICAEELSLAMKTIAQHSFGITPENLLIVTAREFGFKHTGKNIMDSLRKAYQQMLKKGEVTEVDGKVHIHYELHS